MSWGQERWEPSQVTAEDNKEVMLTAMCWFYYLSVLGYLPDPVQAWINSYERVIFIDNLTIIYLDFKERRAEVWEGKATF